MRVSNTPEGRGGGPADVNALKAMFDPFIIRGFQKLPRAEGPSTS